MLNQRDPAGLRLGVLWGATLDDLREDWLEQEHSGCIAWVGRPQK